MTTWRQIQAAERREQSAAQRRKRELERLARESAKRSAEEQARLEVATYENRLEVLLSIHRDQGDPWDWAALAASLPRPCPLQGQDHELRARERLLVSPPQQHPAAETAIAQARCEDERTFQEAMRCHEAENARWKEMKSLAQRVLRGEHKAYIEALVGLSPLREIADLGSSVSFTVHSAKLVEAALKVNGTQAIPSDVKTLTASGRVSVRPMAKSRFHEIYQDYAWGCVLRVAREVFALLPIETMLVTAYVDAVDGTTGLDVELPVLSVAIPRAVMNRLDFDRLDPSDPLENFIHRGDFKASRKTGSFLPVVPLAPADIVTGSAPAESLGELLVRSRKARGEISARIAQIAPTAAPPTEETPPTFV